MYFRNCKVLAIFCDYSLFCFGCGRKLKLLGSHAMSRIFNQPEITICAEVIGALGGEINFYIFFISKESNARGNPNMCMNMFNMSLSFEMKMFGGQNNKNVQILKMGYRYLMRYHACHEKLF